MHLAEQEVKQSSGKESLLKRAEEENANEGGKEKIEKYGMTEACVNLKTF